MAGQKKVGTNHIVFRPSFEAVSGIQQDFRKHLEQLTKQNRPLKDETERDLFHNELAHSTLGTGIFKSYEILHDGRIWTCGNVESTSRFLAGAHKNKVSIRDNSGTWSPPIPIKFLWRKLLESLFYVFPVALEKSISISKETEVTKYGEDSFNVRGK